MLRDLLYIALLLREVKDLKGMNIVQKFMQREDDFPHRIVRKRYTQGEQSGNI
jgi:predicted RNA polymerase sigma factor